MDILLKIFFVIMALILIIFIGACMIFTFYTVKLIYNTYTGRKGANLSTLNDSFEKLHKQKEQRNEQREYLVKVREILRTKIVDGKVKCHDCKQCDEYYKNCWDGYNAQKMLDCVSNNFKYFESKES